MNIGQLVRNLVGDMLPADGRQLELKVGQVVKGMVLQVIAESEALVNINGTLVKARLETPLQQGQVTLLQVQPASLNGQIVLKPLAMSPQVQIAPESLVDLVKTLGLSDTKAGELIVRQMHRETVPLTKENAQSLKQTLDYIPTGVKEEEWLQAGMLAQKRGLPVTKETVGALKQVLFGSSLDQLMSDVAKQASSVVEGEGNTDQRTGGLSDKVSMQLKQLQSIIRSIYAEPHMNQGTDALKQTTGGEFARTASQNNGTSGQTSQETAGSHTHQNNSLTSKLGTMLSGAAHNFRQPSSSSTLNIIDHTDVNTIAMGKANIKLDTNGTSGTARQEETPLVNQADGESSSSPSESSKQVQQGLSTRQQDTMDYGQGNKTHRAEQEQHRWVSRVMKMLGVEHEQTNLKSIQLAESKTDRLFDNDQTLLTDKSINNQANEVAKPATPIDTLKGVLLQLSQSDELPPTIKETILQLTQQVTGQQLLLTSDRNSMFTHVTMFVPFRNEQGEQTASVHIQSRKGKRGELDKDNCHLLFDLQMKALGNTLLDVQVVNRIVTLKVHNDFPAIAEIMESNRDGMNEAMEKIGYQFLSLKCEPYPKRLALSDESAFISNTTFLSSITSPYSSSTYKKVDYRI